MIELDSIMELSYNYSKEKGEKYWAKNIFEMFEYLIEQDNDTSFSMDVQSVLLYSSIMNRKMNTKIARLSKEYITYLNKKYIYSYIEGGIIEEDRHVICAGSYLEDIGFDYVKKAILNPKNKDAFKRAIHLISFSEDDRCIELLKENTPKGFVLVPAGEFVFGSNYSLDEKYNKSVWIPSFYITKYPITMEAYENGFLDESVDSKDLPCHGVTWYEAFEYTKKNGYNLPTEAQWEKASRGNDGRMYPWGNEFNIEYVNSYENGIDGFLPVNQYENTSASPFGVVDSVGNCWEWTSSLYEKYSEGLFILGSDDQTKGDRVLRGGAYDFDSYGVTCTNRYRCNPENGWDTHGFRAVINL